jgi:hypothetical protein
MSTYIVAEVHKEPVVTLNAFLELLIHMLELVLGGQIVTGLNQHDFHLLFAVLWVTVDEEEDTENVLDGDAQEILDLLILGSLRDQRLRSRGRNQ